MASIQLLALLFQTCSSEYNWIFRVVIQTTMWRFQLSNQKIMSNTDISFLDSIVKLISNKYLDKQTTIRVEKLNSVCIVHCCMHQQMKRLNRGFPEASLSSPVNFYFSFSKDLNLLYVSNNSYEMIMRWWGSSFK